MSRISVRRLVALVFAASALAVAAPAASAAGIVVTSLGAAVGNDGVCTLNEAIAAANGDTASGGAVGECAAGAGADVITFAVSGTIYGGGWDLTSDATIDGGGSITIDASGIGGGSRHLLVESGATVTLAGLTLTGGTAQYSGSIYNHGTLTIQRTSILDNAASAQGGGIYNQSGGVLTVRDSTIAGNFGGTGGGLYVETGSAALVTGSTISGNLATGAGAAYVSGTLVLANSTVAGNSAEAGAGGIVVSGGSASLGLLNVTVTGNAGTAGGDGLAAEDASAVTVRNTIIAGNGDTQTSGTLDVNANSVIAASASALLGPLADNGGPTRTAKLLPTGAAAIDAGDDATCAAAPVSGVDQRGLPRPSGAHCDIGAVERDGDAPVATTPQVSLASGVTLAGSSPRIKLSWGGSDTGGSGVASYVLQRSVAGGVFTTIATPAAASAVVAVGNGSAYRFRVAAVDGDGNQGGWATSRSLATTLTQQTYSGITYIGSWRTSSSSRYSGGSVKGASKGGAWARFLFTGRGIAFVSTQSSARGRVKIYINGSLKKTLDLTGATTYRKQVWAYTWSSSATRTIKVVVSGTPGRPRVDVDAFVVLK
jgi:hypothetical protein